MMHLYSDPECPLCHRVRLAIAEKGIAVTIHNSNVDPWPEEVATAVPYGKSPVFVDRDVVLFDSNIIIDYLDARFIQAPLYPLSPAEKAQFKMTLYRIDHDWYSLWNALSGLKKSKMAEARRTLREDLTVLAPLFDAHPYFMSESFSMLDCSLAPLLWRLPKLNITLPAKSTAIDVYSRRLFNRPSFQTSLSNEERAMRS
jgi:RNA polymerase-associated protein